MPYKDPQKRRDAQKRSRLKYPQKYKDKAIRDNNSPQHRISTKKWREANPEHQSEYYLSNADRIKATSRKTQFRNIGWTPEMYAKVFTEQKGVCAICGNSCPSGRNLAADHEHTNPPKPRGLLCVVCNLMIGYAKDSIDTLNKAIEYIKKYKDPETTQGDSECQKA